MSSLDRYSSQFRFIVAAALALLLAVFVITTRRWPLVGDASLVRYAVFLMHHGFAPYRDIVDINMPGAYLVDWLVTHLFGSGAAAWRIFDFALLAAAGVSFIFMSRSIDWLAGFIAAALFALLHAADGVAQTGQRDLAVAVLCFVSMTFFFRWMRTRQLWPIALAALLTGFAVTIKPTAFLFALAFAVLMFALPEKRSAAITKHLLAAVIAFALPFLLVLAFLLREHALHAFLAIVRGLLPFHAGLSHRSLAWLLAHSVAPLQIFLLPWIFLFIRAKSWGQWQSVALLAAMACGLFSYIVQGKGYPYHRYPLIGFLLLAMAMEFIAACRRGILDRTVGVLAIIGLVFVTAPIATIKAARFDWRDQEFIAMLQSDLKQQGGAQLSGQVQCLDTTSGCINTLARMKLVQATGYLYDCYLFAPGQTPATERLRNQFLDEIERAKPRIIVLSNQVCLNGVRNFNKVENWPQFNQYFSRNYTLLAERQPPHLVRWWSRPERSAAYRVYKRNAGNLPARSPSHIP